MRYVTFSLPTDRTERLGIVRGDRVFDAARLAASQSSGSNPPTLLELIQAGPDAWRRMSALLGQSGNQDGGVRLQEVRCHAPIPRPRKNILCLGLNYASHAQESSRARDRPFKIPEVPVFFTKAPTTVNGPFDDVPWDSSATEQVDYEAELGVVIGVPGKNISRSKALDHVFGYTIINDVSARDLQLKHMQWFKGKSLDGFCPMGPVVVTSDEFGNPQAKRISLRVNGNVKQDSTTADMIFPEGVGLGRTPPEYLNDGDIVETEVEGIGVMKNRIKKL
jgi:2-keto-4-pentenoate hydratase/2-oxohepta-3-ene-1,7-dioic acid hydratase in catechol pathway